MAAVSIEELDRRVIKVEENIEKTNEGSREVERLLQHEIRNGDQSLRNFETTMNEKINDLTLGIHEKIDAFTKSFYKNVMVVIITLIVSILLNVGSGFYWAGQIKQTTVFLYDKIEKIEKRVERLEDRKN